MTKTPNQAFLKEERVWRFRNGLQKEKMGTLPYKVLKLQPTATAKTWQIVNTNTEEKEVLGTHLKPGELPLGLVIKKQWWTSDSESQNPVFLIGQQEDENENVTPVLYFATPSTLSDKEAITFLKTHEKEMGLSVINTNPEPLKMKFYKLWKPAHEWQMVDDKQQTLYEPNKIASINDVTVYNHIRACMHLMRACTHAAGSGIQTSC